MNKQGMIIENNAIYVSRLFAGAKQRYFYSLDLSLIADNKKFWKTVKPLFSDKISHKDIISLTEYGKTIIEDLPIAEIFNNYFSNVIEVCATEMSPQN